MIFAAFSITSIFCLSDSFWLVPSLSSESKPTVGGGRFCGLDEGDRAGFDGSLFFSLDVVISGAGDVDGVGGDEVRMGQVLNALSSVFGFNLLRILVVVVVDGAEHLLRSRVLVCSILSVDICIKNKMKCQIKFVRFSESQN